MHVALSVYILKSWYENCLLFLKKKQLVLSFVFVHEKFGMKFVIIIH